jgi:hypothetical protein
VKILARVEGKRRSREKKNSDTHTHTHTHTIYIPTRWMG